MIDRLLVLLFLGVLVLPGLVQLGFAAADRTPEVLAAENRRPAPWPDAREAASVRELTSDLEAWASDRVGFRDALLGLHGSIRDELGLVNAGDEAVEGRDGWYFLSQGGRMQEDFEGRAPLSTEDAADWARRLGLVAAEAEAPGVMFHVMIAPDKQTVYPDRVSSAFRHAPERTRRARLVPSLRAAGLDVTDAAPALLEASEGDETLYHRTDTHWTARGAFVAYEDLMRDFRARGVEVPVVDEARLVEADRQAGWSGDLPPLIGRRNVTETLVRLRIEAARPITRTQLGDSPDPTLQTVILRGGPEDAPSLTLYGDSFATEMMPYLAQSFSRVTVLRRVDELADLERLRAHPADIVLVELVERMIGRPLTVTGTSEG